MSDEINYQESWDDENSQCKNCKSFQTKDGKNACVPEDKNFEQALKEYGEIPPTSHCNYFQKK